ncbi:hypothetical protein GPJ56_007554 [Histomonas meleagridis]|uniref:uncharacterized protein n=1 Tax=Histomonas meleagridis TaxID=135588 RepID=UPI0035594545|nr:hypothetical protein GPJ56_007554 [Histomonas meleagridis]KAH0806073.1 hypothetical protein GO595_001086 [Histomonas meleagridis]
MSRLLKFPAGNNFANAINSAIKKGVSVQIISTNFSNLTPIEGNYQKELYSGSILTDLMICDNKNFIMASSIYDTDFIEKNDVIGIYVKDTELINVDAKRFFEIIWESLNTDGIKELSSLRMSYDLLARTMSTSPCQIGKSSLYFSQSPYSYYPLNRDLTSTRLGAEIKLASTQMLISTSTIKLNPSYESTTNIIARAIKGAQVNVLLSNNSEINNSLISSSYIAGVPGINVRVSNKNVNLPDYIVIDGSTVIFASTPVSNDILTRNPGLMLTAYKTTIASELIDMFNEEWNNSLPFKDFADIPFPPDKN